MPGFISTRWAALRDSLSTAPLNAVAALAAVIGIAVAVPAFGAHVFSSEEGGIAVRQVEPGSLAERVGTRQGDVILAVNGHETPGAGALEAALRVASRSTPKVDVLREGRAIELDGGGDAGSELAPGLGVLVDQHLGGFGVTVNKVFAGGVGDALGIQSGDKIKAIDGVPLWASGGMRSLAYGIRLSRETAELTVERYGPNGMRTLTLRGKLGGSGPSERLLGLELQPGTDLSSVPLLPARVHRDGDPRWDPRWGKTGVTLTEVRSGSLAARAGLRAGDVVYAIDLRPTVDADSLQYALGVSQASISKPCTVAYVRNGKRLEARLDLEAPAAPLSTGMLRALDAAPAR